MKGMADASPYLMRPLAGKAKVTSILPVKCLGNAMMKSGGKMWIDPTVCYISL